MTPEQIIAAMEVTDSIKTKEINILVAENRTLRSDLISAQVILNALAQSLSDLQSLLDTHSRQSDSKPHETLPTKTKGIRGHAS